MSDENLYTFENEQYRRTYWHTCSHVLAQAMKRLHPEVKLLNCSLLANYHNVRSYYLRIYEDRKEQLDSNLYFPLTDGHLGYNIPVNLRKCQQTDGAEIYRVFSKVVMFTTIDDAWRDHLREMDDLRQSVQNATYEQKDPLLIYKFESFGLFQKMLIKVNRDTLAILCKAFVPVNDQRAEAAQRQQQQRDRAKVDVNKLQASRMQAAAQAGQAERQKPMPVHVEKKIGRNDPCPCGSGKKYKNCHGKGL